MNTPLTKHGWGGNGMRPTLTRKTTEAIPHSCDNGHTWFAMMYPVRGQEQWNYVNSKQRWCPECGAPQSDEEPIL